MADEAAEDMVNTAFDGQDEDEEVDEEAEEVRKFGEFWAKFDKD